jgi:hypothetical protein
LKAGLLLSDDCRSLFGVVVRRGDEIVFDADADLENIMQTGGMAPPWWHSNRERLAEEARLERLGMERVGP